MRTKLGFRNKSLLQATRADAHVRRRAIRQLDMNTLQVGQEAATSDTGRMQTDAALALRQTVTNDPVPHRRVLSANLTNS